MKKFFFILGSFLLSLSTYAAMNVNKIDHAGYGVKQKGSRHEESGTPINDLRRKYR